MITPGHANLTKEKFLQMLEHFPQLIFWLDAHQDGFIGGNTKFANFCGLDSAEDLMGQEGFPFFAKEAVMLIRECKKEVVETKKTVQLSEEIHNNISGQTVFEITLAPILNSSGKVSSVICYGTPLLTLADKPWSKAMALIDKKNMSKLLSQTKYNVSSEHGIASLSKREAECCLFLLKGLTTQEIADNIFLAQRTVINHLENVKDKLGCNKRSELIGALTNGKFIENNF